MKKILTTALVGALVAGLAFADIGFDYTGTAIINGPAKALGETKSGSVGRKDCLSIDFSNDKAGVVFDFDIEAYDKNLKATAPELALDQFYGWLTFALPVGNLQVTTGKWAGRWASRLKGDAGDLDDDFYEAYKLGTIETALEIGKDIDNLTGKDKMSTVLAYTLNDVLPGSLMVKAGLVSGDYNGDNKNADVKIKSGFVGEVCYRQENLFKFNVAFKTLKQDRYGVGIFVSPLMLDKLGATVGFSFGLDSEEDVSDYFEYGVDLRLRYQITDKWAVTTMHNISGWNTSYKADDKDDEGTNAMWNMLSTSYKAGDNIRFIATVQNTVKQFDAKCPDANVLAITPACEISAGDHAMVTAGFDIRWTGKALWGGVGDIRLPVYVSFSL
ncbi:MAG: hypothetical protein K2K67_06730 [Treponemataceae bacterium]|nr:hypothetical protein [Treponemataceae bacterium]